jgi:mersacidin/lichenicidin family type 2 lantibiotic
VSVNNTSTQVRRTKKMDSMSIIKAWKDETYRHSLSEAEQAALPQNPAGMLELTDAELAEVAGGRRRRRRRSRSRSRSRSRNRS